MAGVVFIKTVNTNDVGSQKSLDFAESKEDRVFSQKFITQDGLQIGYRFDGMRKKVRS
jgi:hypothetical protein